MIVKRSHYANKMTKNTLLDEPGLRILFNQTFKNFEEKMRKKKKLKLIPKKFINIFGVDDPLLYPMDYDGMEYPLGTYLIKYHEIKSSDTVIIRNEDNAASIEIIGNGEQISDLSDDVSKVA